MRLPRIEAVDCVGRCAFPVADHGDKFIQPPPGVDDVRPVKRPDDLAGLRQTEMEFHESDAMAQREKTAFRMIQ